MCTGWNQPPDWLVISHCSTSNGLGLPNSLENPDFSTSSQVTPLMVHSPWTRSTLSCRLALAIWGVRLMVEMPPRLALTAPPSSRVVGSAYVVAGPESATTWNRMILFV